MSNIRHDPSMSKSLLSNYQFTKYNNVLSKFHPNYFIVKDHVTKQPLLTCPSDNSLYTLHISSLTTINATAFWDVHASLAIWHHCLGHPH